MKRTTLWLLLVAALICVPALSVTAVAQDQQDEASDEVQIEDDFMQTQPQPQIDEYLEGDMEVLAGEGATYDPGDRRDPFISLMAPSKAEETRGPRPPGIPGLMIDDVEITGIFFTAEGPVAQVRVADKRQSYLLRERDQLFDGDVTSIAFDEVVFKQILDDPTALKPFQPVVKKLKSQGGKGE